MKSGLWSRRCWLVVPVLLLSVILPLGSCSSLKMAQHRRQLRNGLALYFPFDRNFRDASGKGNHGIPIGATLTDDRAGRRKAACWFSGRSFIEVKSSPSLNLTEAITIAAWVRHDPVSRDETVSRFRPQEEIVCKMNTGFLPNKGYRLAAWWLNPHGYACELYDGEQHICDTGQDPAIGRWTHVAATWDGEMIRLYQDGKQMSSSPFKGTISPTDDPLLVGIHAWKNQSHFRGAIDELRIYNRALSHAEIAILCDE
jgi:hypothetical protein